MFGGTFDPVHLGHVAVVDAARTQLVVDRVHVVPARVNPLRSEPTATAPHRLRMLQIAFAGREDVVCDERELRRHEPSYSVLTLESLSREYPGAALVLVLGADVFAGLPRWYEYLRLLELAHVAVVNRPGTDSLQQLPEWAQGLERRQALDRSVPGGHLLRLEITPFNVSSTEIRRRLAAGESAEGLLPTAVLDYITKENLYV